MTTHYFADDGLPVELYEYIPKENQIILKESDICPGYGVTDDGKFFTTWIKSKIGRDGKIQTSRWRPITALPKKAIDILSQDT